MVNIYTGNAPTPGFTDRELHEQYVAKQKKKYSGANQDATSSDKSDILINMSSSSPYQDPSAQLEAAQTMIGMSQSGIPVPASASSSSPAPVPGPATNISAANPKISLHEDSPWEASGIKKYSEYLAWKDIHMDFEPSETLPGKIEAKKARE